MTEPARTLKVRHPIQTQCAASTPDGFHNVENFHLLIMVETAAEPITPPHVGGLLTDVDKIEAWIADYITGKDLTYALDFPPTARNLALYLSRVFSGIDSTVNAVSVSINGGEVATIGFVQ